MAAFRFSVADLLLLLTVMSWGIGFPIAKYAIETWPPLTFATIRYALTAILLLIWLYWRDGRLRFPRQDFWPILGLGLIGVALLQSVWIVALSNTSPAKASIIVSLSPVWATIMTTLKGGPKPQPRVWIGFGLALLGTMLLMNNSFTEFRLAGGSLLGDGMFVIVSLLWAGYTAYAPTYIARHGALNLTVWSVTLGTILLLPVALLDIAQFDPSTVAPLSWGSLAFSVVLAGVFGFVGWYEGVKQLGVARASVYSYLIPVFGVVSSTLLLNDGLSSVQLISAGVVLFGVVMVRSSSPVTVTSSRGRE